MSKRARLILPVLLCAAVAALAAYVVLRPSPLEKLKAAALTDHKTASYKLAQDYHRGNGVPKDDEKAYYWLDLNFGGIDITHLNDPYMNLWSTISDRLSRKQQATVEEKVNDAKMRREGCTLEHPAKDTANANIYCRHAISENKDEASRNADFRDGINTACALEILAQKGDTLSKSRLKKISVEKQKRAQAYVPEALKLWQGHDTLNKRAARDDLDALVTLGRALPSTDRAAYLALYDKKHNVIDPPEGAFPVTVFDNDDVPLPDSKFVWLDNNTVIYHQYKEEPPTDRFQLYQAKAHAVKELKPPPTPVLQPRQESFISVNLVTLEKKTDCTKKDMENSHPHMPDGKNAMRRMDRRTMCPNLIPGDGYACYTPTPQGIQKQPLWNNPYYRSVTVTRDDGSQKTFHFDRAIFPLRFHYNAFSNQYWIASENKVWRFDRKFEHVTEELYPFKPSGREREFVNHGIGRVPANYLKYSTRHGFLIRAHFSSPNLYDEYDTVFQGNGIFLLQKNVKSLRVYTGWQNNIGDNSFSISPDGCKALFLKYGKVTKKRKEAIVYSSLYGIEANVAMIDLCRNPAQQPAETKP